MIPEQCLIPLISRGVGVCYELSQPLLVQSQTELGFPVACSAVLNTFGGSKDTKILQYQVMILESHLIQHFETLFQILFFPRRIKANMFQASVGLQFSTNEMHRPLVEPFNNSDVLQGRVRLSDQPGQDSGFSCAQSRRGQTASAPTKASKTAMGQATNSVCETLEVRLGCLGRVRRQTNL